MAARAGEPVAALDPAALTQRLLVMPFLVRWARPPGVSFELCPPGDISILRRHVSEPPLACHCWIQLLILFLVRNTFRFRGTKGYPLHHKSYSLPAFLMLLPVVCGTFGAVNATRSR
jgi:hypothetical protein